MSLGSTVWATLTLTRNGQIITAMVRFFLVLCAIAAGFVAWAYATDHLQPILDFLFNAGDRLVPLGSA